MVMNVSAEDSQPETDRRKNVKASIELLSSIRDKMIIANEETFNSRLLMWLIEQLQQSLLVLDTIKNEHV